MPTWTFNFLPSFCLFFLFFFFLIHFDFLLYDAHLSAKNICKEQYPKMSFLKGSLCVLSQRQCTWGSHLGPLGHPPHGEIISELLSLGNIMNTGSRFRCITFNNLTGPFLHFQNEDYISFCCVVKVKYYSYRQMLSPMLKKS